MTRTTATGTRNARAAAVCNNAAARRHRQANVYIASAPSKSGANPLIEEMVTQLPVIRLTSLGEPKEKIHAIVIFFQKQIRRIHVSKHRFRPACACDL